MAVATNTAPGAVHTLTLPEELILTLLNEETGYFYQVPGWNLNCAMVGAALAELSLIGRIDTDMDALILLDHMPTGDPLLDPILTEISAESESHNVRYWIERLAPQSGEILSRGLDGLVERGILEHHPGEFWTISHFALQTAVDHDGQQVEFVKTRVRRIIFALEIPDPRDVIIIALANACDVLRYIYELNDPFPERIELICRMDLIGHAIGDAVSDSIAAPGAAPRCVDQADPDGSDAQADVQSRYARGPVAGVFRLAGEGVRPGLQVAPLRSGEPL